MAATLEGAVGDAFDVELLVPEAKEFPVAADAIGRQAFVRRWRPAGTAVDLSTRGWLTTDDIEGIPRPDERTITASPFAKSCEWHDAMGYNRTNKWLTREQAEG